MMVDVSNICFLPYSQNLMSGVKCDVHKFAQTVYIENLKINDNRLMINDLYQYA